AYRADLAAQSEHRGVQVAQQAVTQGGLALDQVFDFVDIEFGPGNGLPDPQVIDTVLRNLMRGQGLGTAEEVSLEIREADLSGNRELLARFDLLRQHLAARRP